MYYSVFITNMQLWKGEKMSGNFLYFNYIKPGTRYYEEPKRRENQNEYLLDLPSTDWEISEFTNWKFYSNPSIKMQDQGWKIHISATTETAEVVLTKVGGILFEKNIAFKHVANESFLELMNSKHGNRASAGKFIAIYPDDEMFPQLLEELHECLKDVEKGPYILSDRSWRNGNVYYRYGGFKKMVTSSGELAIRNKEGQLVPDNRTPYYRVPDFIDVPDILKVESQNSEGKRVPSKLSQYKIIRALRFNNGGGIYLAEERESRTTVVIKEARPKVGYDGNGQDAEHRLNIEYSILKRLTDVKGVVKIKDYFKVWENTFLVEEFVEGIDLTHWVSSTYPFHQSQDTSEYLKMVKHLISNIIETVKAMHLKNVGMGDLQPSNIIVSNNSNITLIDFESAQDLYCKEKPAMMTVGFAHADNQNHLERDWYGVKRILKYCILPVGPIEVLNESNKAQQDIWIKKTYGKEFFDYFKAIERECDSYLKETKEKNVVEDEMVSITPNIDNLIQGLRKGIETNYSERKSLIKGDIRQYEMECGYENVLVGGFGAILALKRTGNVDKKAKEWIEKYLSGFDEGKDPGLFTGISGIASVLYENGYEDEALKIFNQLMTCNNIPDISLRSGMSGIALALAFLYEKVGDKKYLDASANMANSIKQYIVNNGEIKVRDWAAVPIGLTDGLAGVSLLFAKLYQLTGERSWYEFAKDLIRRDLERTHISEDMEILQSLDERMRLLPYLSGGSLGIAVAIWFLNHMCKCKHFEKEMQMILNLSKLRCTFSVGLFDGLGSLLLIPSMIKNVDQMSQVKKQLLEKLNMYLIYEKDKGILCPGNFSYRLSEDVFSGSSGIILALQCIKSANPLLWLPLVGVEDI